MYTVRAPNLLNIDNKISNHMVKVKIADQIFPQFNLMNAAKSILRFHYLNNLTAVIGKSDRTCARDARYKDT